MIIRLNGNLNQLFRTGGFILKTHVNRMSSKKTFDTGKRVTRSGVKRKNPESYQQDDKTELAATNADDYSINENLNKVVKIQKKSKKKENTVALSKENVTSNSDDSDNSEYKPKKVLKKSEKLVKKSTNPKNKEPTDKVKHQLEIPEIKIPKNLETVPRISGPSSWNGTTCYTNQIYLGAHISAAGGLENAVTNAVKIGATSFALFLKSQRQWNSKPLEESTVQKFKDACEKHKIASHLILPHGSYLMNLGSHDPILLSKSRALLLDEMQRCDRLGLLYFNIHPGSTCGKISREESIQNIADSINWVHEQTKGSKVSVVLENMCRQGHTIGGDLSELASIIRLTFDQSRIGVCIDTCHALAAGYDLTTAEGFQTFLDEFKRTIGFEYLVAVHLNDSEGSLDCKRDRHASIGKGHIGKADGFERIINCKHFRDIPVVLETPYISDDTYRDEILLLKSMIDTP